jgi:hypothetical protein
MAEVVDNRIVIWNCLEKTDKKFTKDFGTDKSFRGTAINPAYVQAKLTQTFGPCGIGWKFVLEHEEYREGHKLKSGDTCVVHIIRGHLEYFWEGEWRSTGPQYGQTTFVGENKWGSFTDDEAPKKSCTDALTKACVSLGMSYDIFSGQWDSNKYIHKPLGPLEGENVPAAEKPKTRTSNKKPEPESTGKGCQLPEDKSAEPAKTEAPACEPFETYRDRIDGKKKPEEMVLLISKLVKDQALIHNKDTFIKVCDHLADVIYQRGEAFEPVAKKFAREVGNLWLDKIDACQKVEVLFGLWTQYIVSLSAMANNPSFARGIIKHINKTLEENHKGWDSDKALDLKDKVRITSDEIELHFQGNERFGGK